MKKCLCVAFVLLTAVSVFAAPAKNVPAMIGIHIGPAHPTFVESLYPDIKFFYLPEYKVEVTKDKKDFFASKAKLTAGEGLIADLFNEKLFMAFPRYMSYLFDKGGVCVFEGWLGVSSKSATDEKFKMQNASMNQSDKKALKVSLDDYVQKGKTGKANPKKNLVKDKDYNGGTVPDLTVLNAAGESKKLADIVAEAGPSLVFFFTVPADATPEEVSLTAQLASTNQGTTNAATPDAFLGAIAKMAVTTSNTYTSVLDQIELDFFGYLVNKAR